MTRPDTPVDGAPHGTLTGYKNYHCGCRACRDANNAYHRVYTKAWRAARRAKGLTVRGTPRKNGRVGL